jgi:hypothetical protein
MYKVIEVNMSKTRKFRIRIIGGGMECFMQILHARNIEPLEVIVRDDGDVTLVFLEMPPADKLDFLESIPKELFAMHARIIS